MYAATVDEDGLVYHVWPAVIDYYRIRLLYFCEFFNIYNFNV